MEFTAIDLFCGAGGTSLGLIKSKFEVLTAIDNDNDALTTYEKNLKIKPVNSDIRKITGKSLLRNAGLAKGELTLLAGCPPCQGFTRLQSTLENDPRNKLVAVYAKLVKDIMPQFILFENVSGILSPKNKNYFDNFLKLIGKYGYKTVYGVLQATDYGVPQFRKRVIAIATREEGLYSNLKLPKPTHGNPDTIEDKGLNKWKTVKEAFKGLPPLKAGQNNKKYPNHTAPLHSERILKLIKLIPKNGGSRTDLPRRMWLRCHKDHKGHKDVYGRLKWGRPSPCITSGCVSASKGRYIHPIQNRTISLREAARLQSFPDNFVFYGNMTSVGRQIGNAMPSILSEAVGNSIQEIV